ncbi:MAG TPA: response regulator [Anaerolineae bacterium]|nr:response regulator [Anaerolineae bacterium]
MPTERVLVVDDDPAILTLCHRILEADGYKVVDAKRGEEALAKLEAEPFDLLLTDIRLPGLTGLEVTERLRERGLDLTVVTMTGYSNMEMAIHALSLGVDEFIVKPFTPDTLRVHVARALEKWHLRHENTRLRTLVPLLQRAQAFAGARNREQVYAELFQAARELLDTDDIAFCRASAERDSFTLVEAQGAHLSSLQDTVWFTTQLPDAAPFLSDRVQVWNEAEEKRLSFALDCLKWMISAPLRAHDKTLGLLLVARNAAPSQADIEALHLIVSQAATALENVDLLSEISRAYINARELERLKSEFINIAGHEIRTPLSILLGYAMLLHERLDGEERGFAAELVTHAQRLQRIVDDMLNLKYLEAGHVDLRLERCSVNEVVRDVVNAYRPLAAEREQSIDLSIAEQTGDVTADRAMLDLMLGNLLSNAIKFSPRKSHVRVGAEGDAQQVTLLVQDEGKGLAAEDAEHVFDAFYQAGSSLTRQEGGLGLGLTITREMVRAHHGKIWFERRSPAGSCFYISLPRDAKNGESNS